jgi:hypothetical protein
VDPLVVQVVACSKALRFDLGVNLHFASFFGRDRVAPSFALSRYAVMPLDIGANKLKACALVERPSWRGWLGLFIDRVGRFCCSRRLEAGIPFEVAQRAPFFCLIGTRGVQRKLHDFLAKLFNEVERKRRQ